MFIIKILLCVIAGIFTAIVWGIFITICRIGPQRWNELRRKQKEGTLSDGEIIDVIRSTLPDK